MDIGYVGFKEMKNLKFHFFYFNFCFQNHDPVILLLGLHIFFTSVNNIFLFMFRKVFSMKLHIVGRSDI